jgi:hypothetical protein
MKTTPLVVCFGESGVREDFGFWILDFGFWIKIQQRFQAPPFMGRRATDFSNNL